MKYRLIEFIPYEPPNEDDFDSLDSLVEELNKRKSYWGFRIDRIEVIEFNSLDVNSLITEESK